MSDRRAGELTEVLHAKGGDVLRARKAQLKVDKGPAVTSAADRISIGSVAGNDLVLDDRSVSRFHAELVRCEQGYRLKDLGSTNGTWVGNLRVTDVFLEREATLKLGSSTVRFSLGREKEELPLYGAARFGNLVGRSVPMRMLFAQLEKLSKTQATVLIQGESGTGKENVARALHEHGPRKGGPFVVVDCGSIPSELVESELFGHEKGAFTGAQAERRGAFEAAKGGTLFLDEIGELPLAVQPKLLRALEAKQVKRVGSDAYKPVDARIVAATHRELREAVNRGQFREDLYYRLAVATVYVPALREHLEDLPLLLEELWDRAHGELGLPPRAFTPPAAETLKELERMPWEGNVRELRNFVERSLALAGDLTAGQLDARAPPPPPKVKAGDDAATLSYGEARDAVVERFEREFLADRLTRAQGNVSRLAREARMDRAYAIKLLHKHGLK